MIIENDAYRRMQIIMDLLIFVFLELYKFNKLYKVSACPFFRSYDTDSDTAQFIGSNIKSE